MDINDIREKYPQYSDLSDQQLVDGLHKKFYSDMPLDQFRSKVGFTAAEEAPKDQPGILSNLAGSIQKGIVNAKQAISQAQVAELANLQAADKEKYGETYQAAPSSELDKISERDKAIADKMQGMAQYGIERKEIEAKRGVNPLSQEVSNIRNTEAYKNADTLDQLKMYGNAIWSKKADIPGYIAGVGLESLPSSLPTIAAAMAARIGGMGTTGAAIAGGAGSSFTEFGNQYAELRAEGLDHKEAWEKAGVKSGVIGLFDAASFNSAGSAASSIMRNIEKGAIKQTAKETGKAIGTQALYGMAGEGLGSAAINQKIDPISVIEEGIGEIAGAPMEAATTYRNNVAEAKANEPAPTTQPAQEKFVINEQGTLVPNPLANAAPAVTPGPAQAVTPATPIPAQAQQDLFAPEALPASSATLTPDVVTGQTQAGTPIEVAAPQAAERAQAEVQRNIFALEQQEQTPQVQQQIATLKEQLPKGPGETLDILKQEFTVLANKGAAIQTIVTDLLQKRDATPGLKDKAEITAQIKPLEAQIETIATRQQELLQQGAKTAKNLEIPEPTKRAKEVKETAVASDLWELAKPTAVIDEKIMEGLGLTKKAPIRKVLKGLDMNNPADREVFVEEVNKHNIKGANINNKAVDNYFKWFNPTQETQNDGRTGVGAVNGTVDGSVQLPSTGVQTAPGVTAPEAEGVGSPVGATAQPDGGEGVSGADGNVALDYFTPEAIENVDTGYKSRSKVIMMPIEDFLKMAKEGLDKEKEAGIEKLMAEGTSFSSIPKLFLEDNEDGVSKVAGHEGRHRARALQKAGATTIPVEIRGDIRWSEQSNPNNFDYVKTWPTELVGENGTSIPYPISREQAKVETKPSKTPTPAPVEAPVAQAQATPAVQAQATPAQPAPVGTQDNAQLFKAAGGKTRPSLLSRVVANTINKLKSWEEAYDKNQLISTQMFGKGQNLFSFDDGFNNRLRSGFMELAGKGDITIQQAQDAMLRATMTQALYRSELAHKFMSMGNLAYDNLTNRWTAVADDVNMSKFEDLIKSFASRTGVDVEVALDQISKAYEANRVMEFYDSLATTRAEITRTDKKVKELTKNKKRTKEESKDLGVKQAYLDKLKKTASDLEHKTMHMTRQQALIGMQLYNANPEIAEGSKIWNTMRERAIGWLVGTGVKTQEQAEDWLESLAYVPFQRVMDEDEALGLVVANKGIRENMTDKRMKGSMLEVDNTIGNMYQWMQWSISRAISNQQLNVMLDSYKTVAPEEVREGAGKKGNTFTVYQDGTKREYNVANPAVAQAFIGAQSLMFPGIGALRGFKTAFTHAFTRLPLFPTAQLIFKDTWEAMFTSGLKQPWMLLKQIPAEIAKTAMGTSEARKAMSEAAVLSTHDTPFLGDANETAAKLHLNEPNAYRKTMRALDKWAALNDNMLRQAVYAQARAEGATHAQAMEKAVEIFNFRRQSGNVGMQIASQIVPFMNAFGQMQRITIKTLSGSGISPQTRAAGMSTLLTTSAVLGMLTFAYAAAVSDDDDYKKMNRTQRDSSFVIPGTGGLRIPIRMGLLTIPKLIGEYLYHAIADKGYTDPQMFKSAMARAVKQQFMPPIGAAISPAVGLATNHDFFYDREIVNATQRKLAPELQFNKNTTELAKVLGKESGISPLNLDYMFKAYLGQYATLIALSNNSIANARGVSRPTPERPTKEFLMNLPGVGSFMTRDAASGALSDFYEAAREVDVIVNSATSMAKYNPKEAREYLDKNRDKIVGTQGIQRALGGLNTKENIIRNMPDVLMTADEKAAKIKDIERQRESLAKPINKIRQKLYNDK